MSTTDDKFNKITNFDDKYIDNSVLSYSSSKLPPKNDNDSIVIAKNPNLKTNNQNSKCCILF